MRQRYELHERDRNYPKADVWRILDTWSMITPRSVLIAKVALAAQARPYSHLRLLVAVCDEHGHFETDCRIDILMDVRPEEDWH